MATYRATIGGGLTNRALGSYSAIPGGYLNTTLGSYAFAAGKQAKVNHDGAFFWADSTSQDFASSKTDEFAVRASGGVRFLTDGGLQVENSSGEDVFALDASGKVTAGALTNNQLSFELQLYHYYIEDDYVFRELPGQHNFCAVVGFQSYAFVAGEGTDKITCRTSPSGSGSSGEWTGPGRWIYQMRSTDRLYCTFACF